ncbi:MAG TPA: NTP transferase domain-containing protein [Dehalococcoidia bacterium]|uniref:MobA-like NTP transferase domain-containing protein n=1 Tax=viral metagenome TaxID=1070528 RepID=A0A6M3KTK6_9ZZZZ|nr:NTP transferase domain-containing protein [Dehalococcoidia bacterium]
MKAIILAAGLTKSTDYHGFPLDYKPKCLLKYVEPPEREPDARLEDWVYEPVPESTAPTILERDVKILRKHGVDEIIVIVGYKADEVMAHSKERNLGLKFVHNPGYAELYAGHVDSLIQGLSEIPPDDAFLLIMGDVIITDRLVENLLKCEKKIGIRKYFRREILAAKLSLQVISGISSVKGKGVLEFCDWLYKLGGGTWDSPGPGTEDIDGRDGAWEVDSIIDLFSKHGWNTAPPQPILEQLRKRLKEQQG